MGVLEGEDDKGLGLMGKVHDHVDLTGSGPFNAQLKKAFPCIPGVCILANSSPYGWT